MNLKISKNYLIFLLSLLAVAIFIKILPFIFLFKGAVNLENNNYVKAYKSLHFAFKLNPENKDIRYNYVLSLTKLLPTVKVQKELYNISEDKIDDSARNLARQIIAKYRSKYLSNYPDNYINQAANDRGIVRWDLSAFPLNVYIDDLAVDVPDYYTIQIFKALKLWEQAVSFVEFKKVDKEKDADLVIKLLPLPDDVCSGNYCKFIVGLTEPQIDKGILNKMLITLYDKDPLNNYFSDKEIFNTVLHEVGHALGVMGHSYNPNDLMYMSTEKNDYEIHRSSFQYITPADRNTIKLLYALVPDVSNVSVNSMDTKGLVYAPLILGSPRIIAEKKIVEAKKYIKNAPQLSAGYIDLASAYVQKEDVELAIRILKKGLNRVRRNDDKFMLYYNLAVVHVNNGDYSEAQNYLNEAKNLKESKETDDLQHIISKHKF